MIKGGLSLSSTPHVNLAFSSPARQVAVFILHGCTCCWKSHAHMHTHTHTHTQTHAQAAEASVRSACGQCDSQPRALIGTAACCRCSVPGTDVGDWCYTTRSAYYHTLVWSIQSQIADWCTPLVLFSPNPSGEQSILLPLLSPKACDFISLSLV